MAGEEGAQGYVMAGRYGATGPSVTWACKAQPDRQAPKAGPVWSTAGPHIGRSRSELNAAAIEPSGMSTISEMAAYMARNPSMELGLDGSINPASAHPINQDLSDRRVSAVRDALIQAGVPAHRIETGAFADPQLRRNRRVDVLLKTRT
jgi:hypothetical protein